MFGFVTFVHPETVKEILAKGNPHYICESRVLVKPYKEKGKVANKYGIVFSIAVFLLCLMSGIYGLLANETTTGCNSYLRGGIFHLLQALQVLILESYVIFTLVSKK
jgi:hypothetical protein